jgi:leader peptidase (prepilin peptidase)/N-methyltransferase
MSGELIWAAAILGAIGGSFLNALSFRLGTGRSVMHGRSQCMRCGHTLRALDLIPIFSYLFLRGRCRYCDVRISPQYPAVEAAAAVLGAGVALLNPTPLAFAFWFVIWMTLLFIVVYDLRHFVIPWSCSGLLALLAICNLIVMHASVVAWIVGPALAAPLLLLSLVSGGRWMGWGDGVLELGLGWMLGLTMGLTAFMLAFWAGAAVGIVLMLWQKGYTMKSELPFAPFLILGAGVAYFFHVDIFSTLPALF